MKKKYILIIVVIAVILLYLALRSPNRENISIYGRYFICTCRKAGISRK